MEYCDVRESGADPTQHLQHLLQIIESELNDKYNGIAETSQL